MTLYSSKTLFVPEDGMGLLHFHTASNPNKFAHKLVLFPSFESSLFHDPATFLRALHGLDSPSSMSCVLREGETFDSEVDQSVWTALVVGRADGQYL